MIEEQRKQIADLRALIEATQKSDNQILLGALTELLDSHRVNYQLLLENGLVEVEIQSASQSAQERASVALICESPELAPLTSGEARVAASEAVKQAWGEKPTAAGKPVVVAPRPKAAVPRQRPMAASTKSRAGATEPLAAMVNGGTLKTRRQRGAMRTGNGIRSEISFPDKRKRGAPSSIDGVKRSKKAWQNVNETEKENSGDVISSDGASRALRRAAKAAKEMGLTGAMELLEASDDL